MKTLRLILGDQLNYKHTWFSQPKDDVTYLMAETKTETSYVKHHIQKILGFFSAMRHFSEFLKTNQHQVIYLKISDQNNKHSFSENIKHLIEAHKFQKFEYLLPDEYRLDQELKALCKDLKIESEAFDTQHFYTKRDDISKFYEGKKEMVMEYFYRNMRKKHDLLMNGKQPVGGKWNYDKSNRKKWSGQVEVPDYKSFRKDRTELLEEIKQSEVDHFGRVDPKAFDWPTTREECLEVLDYFCKQLLPYFGDYEDAMHTEEPMLFHSRLSFAMNTKQLSPHEVIETVIDFYHKHQDKIDISQVEGFVRQILGWREFMRGIYWKEMPAYQTKNALNNKNKLPEFYWTGKTKMNCLSKSINQSLDHAYAHHIQRLMVLGNFALLTMTDPDEVDAWYLGIYIDAIQWVEITNTRGMSQFADGGIVATKPYVSSGSYINKMSNYCKSCHYNVKDKEGEKACPFNNLYWNFLNEKQKQFENNPRMNMMMSLLRKMKPETIENHVKRAQRIINNPDNF